MRNKFYFLGCLSCLLIIFSCGKRPYDYYERAQALLFFQKPDSALKELDQLALLKPEWPRTYVLRSEVYSKKGDYQAAIADLNKAIQLETDKPRKQAQLLSNRALNRQKSQDYDGAERDFREALRLDPNHAEALLGLGNLFYEQKEYDKAIQAYDKALEIRSYFSDAMYNRAIVKYILRDFSGAIDDCDGVLKRNYQYDPAYNFRAILKMELNYYKGAIRDLNRALELNPLVGYYYYNRAKCHQELNKTRKACRDWKTAKKLGYTSLDLELSIACE